MLGQSGDGLPLPGHSIPYSFTQSDIANFLSIYAHDPIVSQYIWAKAPPYGVIWNNPAGYGQMLLWFDASGVLHIVDVTNLSIANQVQKAPYESPDSSLIDNITQQVQSLIAGLPSPAQALTGIEILAGLFALYLVFQIVRGK
jgi:hypothetical protein